MTTADDTRVLLARAERHAAVRWVGIAAFGGALGVLGLSLAAALDGGEWLTVGAAVFATGLALGAFGANNDTAIDAMRRAADAGVTLPPARAAELAHERAVRPERLLALHSLPRLSLILPVVSVSVMAWVAWSAAGAMGWRSEP